MTEIVKVFATGWLSLHLATIAIDESPLVTWPAGAAAAAIAGRELGAMLGAVYDRRRAPKTKRRSKEEAGRIYGGLAGVACWLIAAVISLAI